MYIEGARFSVCQHFIHYKREHHTAFRTPYIREHSFVLVKIFVYVDLNIFQRRESMTDSSSCALSHCARTHPSCLLSLLYITNRSCIVTA
uniref:Uncharacterized protein n=1 Tax=Aegilops tauschii subsp. strangulata TaxID=200361 RepID=A0A453N5E6_AEGTS